MQSNLRRKKLARDARGPLDGIRVLDLSRVLVCNVLTLQLADYGAEVVKVEQPGEGDGLRRLQDGGVPVYWKVFCRNKKSIALDLKSPAGIELLLSLLPNYHLLVENFKPGTLEKLGLSPEVLISVNNKLVIVRASGWGGTGPYRHKLGFGTLIEAFSGFAAKNGFPDSPPLLPNLGLADFICGLHGAFATMVALRSAQEEGGCGQVIDLSILDSMAALLANDAGAYAITGQVPPRVGNQGLVAAPRNLYRTADGHYLALSSTTHTMTIKLFAAIGRPELIDRPEYRANSDRVRNAATLDAILQEFIGQKTLQQNLDYFEEREVTVGPVNDISLFMRDRHVIEREILVEVEDPDVGWLPMPQPAVRLSRTPASIRSSAPKLGEHTVEILQRAGLSSQRIENLIAAGVVAASER